MLSRRQGLKAAGLLAGSLFAPTRGLTAAPTSSPSSEVELTEERARYFVDVSVKGRSGLRFVLDTGASAHFISTRLVEALQLPSVEERFVRGYGGRNRDHVVQLEGFTVGGVELGRMRAIAWSPEALEGHDGLVGYPFLFPRAVLDLSAGRLRLGGAANDGGLRVNARVQRNQTLLLGGLAGAEGQFVLDTGAQAWTISSAHFERIQDSPAYRAARKLVQDTGDGQIRTVAFRPPEIAFGELVIRQPIIRVASADQAQDAFHDVDGLFGVSLLRDFRWSLDQAQATLSATPREPALGG